MLDFRIDTFLTVCNYMNYTKAAKELNITQPGVTQHIKFLEDYFNISLFTYQNRKLSLTPEGETFKTAMTTMKLDEQRLRQQFQQKESALPLAIGFTLTVGEYKIPPFLSSYLAEHPELEANIVIANTQELLKKLDAGELDVAIVEGYFDKSEYEHRIFSTERYIGVCSGKRKGRLKKDYRIEDLLSQRLICREDGSGTLEIFKRFLTEHNLTLEQFKRRITVTNLNVIKDLVKADCGITFLYENAAKKELDSGELIPLPLKDFRVLHDFTCIWRKGSIYNDYYETILDQFSAT